MRTIPLVLVAASTIAACAGGPPPPGAPEPSPDPAFAYAMPASEPLVYEQSDSGGFRMEISGMGPVEIGIVAHTASRLDFEAAGEAVQVTIAVEEVSGRFSNSMGPTVNAGNEHRPGPAVVTVAADGEVTIVQQPQFPPPLGQILTPQSFYKGFFVRLPGEPVEQGATWTDTMRIEETTEGLTTTTTTIVNSVWSRDTVVAGTALAVIDSRMQNTLEVSGQSQGTEIQQSLEGTSTAVTLWDPVARTVIERTEIGQASGTANLPGVGISDIPVSANSRQVLRLRR